MAIPARFAGLSKPAAPANTSTPAPTKASQPAPTPAAKTASPQTSKPVTENALAKARRLQAEAAAAEAAAQAEANEPETIVLDPADEAVEATPESVVTVSSGAQFRALGAFNPGNMAAGLLALAEGAEAKTAIWTYPTLQVVKAGEHGMFAAADDNVPDRDKLPEGAKPVQLVLIGYRIEATLWPQKWEQGVKASPVARGIIRCDDSVTARLALDAFRHFQFTKSPLRGKFDAGEDGTQGPGHPRLTLSLLGYNPAVDGLMVIETQSTYGAVSETASGLARLIDPQQGLVPFPYQVHIVERPGSSKGGNAWVDFPLGFTPDTTGGKAVGAKFQAFCASVAEDAEFNAKYEEWMTGGDRAITAEVVERLRAIKGL